jgi:hypothetical protein
MNRVSPLQLYSHQIYIYLGMKAEDNFNVGGGPWLHGTISLLETPDSCRNSGY